MKKLAIIEEEIKEIEVVEEDDDMFEPVATLSGIGMSDIDVGGYIPGGSRNGPPEMNQQFENKNPLRNSQQESGRF